MASPGILSRIEPPPLKGVAQIKAQHAADLKELERIVIGASFADAGVHVSPDTASRFAAVAACERVISTAHAFVPVVVYRRINDKQREADTGSTVYSLLHDRPNEHQTSYQWRRIKQRDLVFRGDAFSLIVRGYGNRPVELIRLHPDRVEVLQDSATGVVTYRYTKANGQRVVFKRSEILHVWADSDDGLRGINPVRRYRETIGDGIAMRMHGSYTFANGTKLGGYLTAAGKVEGKKDLADDFMENYGGVSNRGKIAVLDQGLKFEQLSMSNEDAQYIEARKFNRAEIAGIFGVPPHMIGDLDKATFSNIEHQAIQFVTSCMGPYFTCWEGCLWRDVLDADPARFVKFNEKGLLRGDNKSQQESLEIQRRNKVINANEWRALQDMNPIPGPEGDLYENPNNSKAPDQAGKPSSGAQP